MGDLISRSALMEAISKLKVDYYVDMYGKYNPIEQATKIINCIEDAPTVEAEPVVHGEWILRGGRLRCSKCDKIALKDYDREAYLSHVPSNYCPNCGTDMRGCK